MAKVENERGNVLISRRQKELQKELIDALGAALPWARRMDATLKGVRSPYRSVAEVLVKLRHQFPGPHGQGYDLKGRSAGYRAVVREAYVQAGADLNTSLSKTLTAGTAYWVRKILLERYGKDKLCEMGIIAREGSGSTSHTRMKARRRGHNKLKDLQEAVGALNVLASDPELIPTEELVRAAIRAVNLLSKKLSSRKASDKYTQIAV